MNGRGGSISALVWILVEETSGALETQNPAEPGQVARAGTNRNAPKHYAGSPQTSSHQSIPEVCVEVRDSLLGMTVQGDHFYHSFRRMQGSAVCGERFLILRGPRRRATQGGAGGSPSQDHWISHCALSPAGCCALRVGMGVCVCVCVEGAVLAAHSCPGRGWSILAENAQDKNCCAPAPEQLHRRLGSLAVN